MRGRRHGGAADGRQASRLSVQTRETLVATAAWITTALLWSRASLPPHAFPRGATPPPGAPASPRAQSRNVPSATGQNVQHLFRVHRGTPGRRQRSDRRKTGVPPVYCRGRIKILLAKNAKSAKQTAGTGLIPCRPRLRSDERQRRRQLRRRRRPSTPAPASSSIAAVGSGSGARVKVG